MRCDDAIFGGKRTVPTATSCPYSGLPVHFIPAQLRQLRSAAPSNTEGMFLWAPAGAPVGWGRKMLAALAAASAAAAPAGKLPVQLCACDPAHAASQQ